MPSFLCQALVSYAYAKQRPAIGANYALNTELASLHSLPCPTTLGRMAFIRKPAGRSRV